MLRSIGREISFISQYGGRLYEGLKETLDILKSKYRLFIVSNCQEGYIEAFLGYHKLNAFFEDYELYGRTGKQKGENIRLLLDRNGISSAVYVGDTQGDLDAADFAGTEFIYAAYGFGCVNRKTLEISSFSDLCNII